MNKIKFCAYNHDTGAIDVTYADGGKIAVLCNIIEDTIELSAAMQSKFDWLIFNEPCTFVGLHLSGTLESYLEWYDGSYREQENNMRGQLEERYSPETARDIAREFMMYDS